MKTLFNKQSGRTLLLSAISLCIVSCSNDNSATDTAKKAGTILSETVSEQKTVAHDATNKTSITDEVTEATDESILAHGEEAHNNHCYKCHTDELYTRENRLVKSIDALSKQVTRCKEGNDIPWFDEDADAVVQFLNNKYYRF